MGPVLNHATTGNRDYFMQNVHVHILFTSERTSELSQRVMFSDTLQLSMLLFAEIDLCAKLCRSNRTRTIQFYK